MGIPRKTFLGLGLDAKTRPNNRRAGIRRAREAGRSLQDSIVLNSTILHLPIFELPASGGRFIGQGKMVSEPMPCDFIGCLPGGLGLFFDAKSVGEERASLRCGNDGIVKPHQRDFLGATAKAGAMAGLFVYCERLHDYRWLDGEVVAMADTVPWDSQYWDVLGATVGESLLKLIELAKPPTAV